MSRSMSANVARTASGFAWNRRKSRCPTLWTDAPRTASRHRRLMRLRETAVCATRLGTTHVKRAEPFSGRGAAESEKKSPWKRRADALLGRPKLVRGFAFTFSIRPKGARVPFGDGVREACGLRRFCSCAGTRGSGHACAFLADRLVSSQNYTFTRQIFQACTIVPTFSTLCKHKVAKCMRFASATRRV